jgi:hypothetical protein
MNEQPTLETPRVLLRPFTLSDAAVVQQLAGDYAIADTTLNIPHPYSDGVAEEWIAGQHADFEAGTRVTYAITLRELGELIGAIGLGIEHRFDRAEMGYWIGKPYWGHGYCTEAGSHPRLWVRQSGIEPYLRHSPGAEPGVRARHAESGHDPGRPLSSARQEVGSV